MPRTGRGGSRQGTPGTAYANRTDLQTRKVPVMTGPSTQYGQATASVQAQQAMPIAAAPTTPPPPPTPGPGAGPTVTPQALTPFDAPSQRPDEHVMTGVSVGPGAGPEALGPLLPQQEDPVVTGLGILNSLGGQVSPEIAHLRAQLSATASNNLAP